MAKTLRAGDTISGREGRAYAKINGNNEELFYLKSIEATVEKAKAEIKALGRRMTGHKTTGENGSGSVAMYYMSPLFRSLLLQYHKTGQDLFFDIVVENADLTSAAGKQTVLLRDCNLDSTVLAKLDADSDDPMDEEMDFTFEDYDILTPFNAI